MKIDSEFIFSGRSIFGGWSRRQVELLGVSWPLSKGWISRAIGMEISEQAAFEFLALKDAHIDPLTRENAKNWDHLKSI